MPTEGLPEIIELLDLWDHATKSKRSDILKLFIKECKGKTSPELENKFSKAASLFLTRLTAWLRLTYMTGFTLKLQLEAISVFITSSSGHKFLAEFLEVGGVLTILEILGLKEAKEEDKIEGLKLLASIAITGRKYKELICESFGVRAVAECLAKSKSGSTQEQARYILEELATGNPRYQEQVYKALISLLSSTSPKAQQLAAHTLKFVQRIVGKASNSIVDPTLLLLQSLHVEVQYEACELIKDLMHYDVKEDAMQRLVSLLHPTAADIEKIPEAFNDASLTEMGISLPLYIQQASAAKCIGMLVKEDAAIAKRFVQLGAVQALLYAMGNSKHPESQKQAGISLEYFLRTFPYIDDAVRKALGDTFYFQYMAQPDEMYLKMNEIKLTVLQQIRLDLEEVN